VLASLSAVLRLLLFVAWTLVCLPVYLPALMARRYYRRISNFYWRMVAEHVLRMRIVTRGQLSARRPLLVVSNHVGYLDIIVLGSLIPGCFVSKAEVRRWPGIGFLARIARTVFVDRRQSSAGRHRDEIANRLRENEPLILFPEGTSSDGNRVLPFKSALFNAAERAVDDRTIHVQPISIAYTRYRGLPMGYRMRPHYAWYGDMDLVTHLWDVLKRGDFTVEVDFLPTTTIESFADRKELARFCEGEVRRGLNGALTGRPVVGGEPEVAGAPAEVVA